MKKPVWIIAMTIQLMVLILYWFHHDIGEEKLHRAAVELFLGAIMWISVWKGE